LGLTYPFRLRIIGLLLEGEHFMDAPYRMRLKIGAHEFEAEGPVNVVQEQVKRFMDLIASLPSDVVAHPYYEQKNSEIPTPAIVATPAVPADVTTLGRIMKLDNRTISLTARPTSAGDAVLLLLLGQKMLRENDAVTGGEVMAGIAATGGLAIPRVDRLLEKMAREGDVIVIGEHRAKRYRLTNTGLAKARQITNDLLAIVA
jgi:hypothetical protein